MIVVVVGGLSSLGLGRDRGDGDGKGGSEMPGMPGAPTGRGVGPGADECAGAYAGFLGPLGSPGEGTGGRVRLLTTHVCMHVILLTAVTNQRPRLAATTIIQQHSSNEPARSPVRRRDRPDSSPMDPEEKR
jgi:hypothetical protein